MSSSGRPNGEYVQYLPRRPPKGILVIAHGSVEEEGAGEADIRKLAQTFLQRWTRLADEHALIAVAPLFDHNFGSWIGEARHRARRISRPRRQGDRRRRARGRHCGAVPRPARRRGAVLSVRPLRGRPVRGPLRRAPSGPSEGAGAERARPLRLPRPAGAVALRAEGGHAAGGPTGPVA